MTTVKSTLQITVWVCVSLYYGRLPSNSIAPTMSILYYVLSTMTLNNIFFFFHFEIQNQIEKAFSQEIFIEEQQWNPTE